MGIRLGIFKTNLTIQAMSTTPRQYLYTAEDIYGKDALDEGMSRDEIWHAYEAARAKDAELIQTLLDALVCTHEDRALVVMAAKNSALAAGFKPSEP